MDLYNEDLTHIGDVSQAYTTMFNRQVDFALSLIEDKEKYRKIIQKRLDNTILVECDIRKGYRTSLYNGEVKKLKFNNNAGAFVSCANQIRNKNGWNITNGIYIRKGGYDMSDTNTCIKTLPHEVFHAMSNNVELNFDKDGYCYTKIGFQVNKYDKQDNEIDMGLNAKLLNEGTTEMLANMFNNTLTPHVYSFPVFIARILSYSNTKPNLFEAYFSDDVADVRKFFDTFDQSQTHIKSSELINAPTGEMFWKDADCLKLIKGCLQYTINSIESVDELKSFYKEIKRATISIADSIALNVGEEHKNRVVEFIKLTLVELLDDRKQKILDNTNLQ